MEVPISIYATAKAATIYIENGNAPEIISIHATAKTATGATEAEAERNVYFNPRYREGNDVYFGADYLLLFISIHATAKATTLRTFRTLTEKSISIHATAKAATDKPL